jgi:hypothetical protein
MSTKTSHRRAAVRTVRRYARADLTAILAGCRAPRRNR